MSWYNCKVDGDQYRITKFDANFDVESSYLTTHAECDCPAGVRPTCRHRQMLPRFLAKRATRGEWFFEFERNRWEQAEVEVEFEEEHAPQEATEIEDNGVHQLGPGVTMLELARVPMETLFNTIAEAVGEPPMPRRESPPSKPAPTINPIITRRL